MVKKLQVMGVTSVGPEHVRAALSTRALMGCFSCARPDRKLAKSTLVLVLVFGIHYIVFVGMPHASKGLSWEVRMYCELFFNSFQVNGTVSSPSSNPDAYWVH